MGGVRGEDEIRGLSVAKLKDLIQALFQINYFAPFNHTYLSKNMYDYLTKKGS